MNTELYKKILEVTVPENENDLNYYYILKIELFEADGRKIHKAGLKQIKKLKEWQLHPDIEVRDEVQNMLNQISFACSVLEVSNKKAEYDKRLSRQLKINLSQDKKYTSALKVEVKLRKCPNCGVEVSKLALLCIDCGYYFKKKKVIKTKVIAAEPEPDSLTKTYKVPGTATTIVKKLFNILYHTLKILIILAILASLTYFIIISIPSKETYEVDIVSSRKKSMCDIIDNSALWQLYFKYRGRDGTPPFVNFKFIRLEETYRKKPVTTFYYEVFKIPGNRILAKGKFRVKKGSQFNKAAGKFAVDSAEDYLSELLHDDDDFKSFVEGAIEKEESYRTRKKYKRLFDKD